MKKVGSMLVMVMVILTGLLWVSGSVEVFADNVNDEIPLVGTAQYEEWKQNHVNQNRMSFFTNRASEAVTTSGNKIYNKK